MDDGVREQRLQAQGLNKCPRCERWLKDDMKNHLYKCWQCLSCEKFVTNKDRHLAICKAEEPKAQKVPCPECHKLLHPQGLLRHVSRAHPNEVEKHRQRPADSKNRSEKRANRRRFYEAHPDQVTLLCAFANRGYNCNR